MSDENSQTADKIEILAAAFEESVEWIKNYVIHDEGNEIEAARIIGTMEEDARQLQILAENDD